MNQETYKLRRKVIDIIYKLKQHLNLPRIEVRITEDHPTYLGMGTMDSSRTIWIVQKACQFNEANLLHLVAHEIGHAVFKLDHDDNCPLMKQGLSMTRPASMETIIKVLSKSLE